MKAHYADGTEVKRGDILIGADGESYDFLSAKHAGDRLNLPTVFVRGVEVIEKPATFFNLTVSQD